MTEWVAVVTGARSLPPALLPPDLAANLPNFETPEFTGRVVAALYRDPARMEHSGKTLIGAELGRQYGVKDTNGKQPPSYRATLGAPHELLAKAI